MGRRKQSPDQEFGSDSFLDVIANIVGILIILIVIVGMKVARQPQGVPQETAEVAAAFELMVKTPDVVTPDTSAADASTASSHDLMQTQQLLQRITELADLQQQAIQLEAELDARLSSAVVLEGTLQEESGDRELLRLRLASLNQDRQRAMEREQQTARHNDHLAAKLTKLRGQIKENAELLEQTSRNNAAALSRAELLEKAIQVTGFETQQLKEVLEKSLPGPETRNRLRHRLSPVGQKVEEGELHFRIAGGLISYVPLEELIERLKSQLQSRRSTVLRLPRYEGTVGPISGYRMNYVVEREQLSPMESLQYSGGFRVGVSRWTIEPDADIVTESVADAIRPGSRFRQLVETANPGSAVTLWIYPDSFGGFPALREVAHGLQLQVAARPLPDNVPITGSPGGSQSTAQ